MRPSRRTERLLLVIALTMAVLGPSLYSGSTPQAPGDAAVAVEPGAVEAQQVAEKQDPIRKRGAAESNPDELPANVVYAPSINLAAPVVPISMSEERVLTPPSNADLVGRWDVSAPPGSRGGQTVITGHTLSAGTGAMNGLTEMEVGEFVGVRENGVTQQYEVTEVHVFSRSEVAESAQLLFGQDKGQGRLVLVSCTDYIAGTFLSNVVVIAERQREA